LCRIVSRVPRRSHITGYRKALHWLPVKHRIMFKTIVMTYKALTTGTPSYLADWIQTFSGSQHTRRLNLDDNCLQPQYPRRIHTSPSQFKHSFLFSAPHLWNELPAEVRLAPSLSTFRNRLKSHLFGLAYPTLPP
jgi:hypothetical protein